MKYGVLLFLGMVVIYPHRDLSAQPASYPARPEAIAALETTSDVLVSSLRGQLYTFRPSTGTPTKGIVLYPGGFVDFRAYALLARDLAREGYVAVIVNMPLDIAFLGYKRALLAQFVNRDVKSWVVGGHSLGGVAACTYVKEFTRFADGVALLASYPSASDSLRFVRIKATSIYGTLDGLTDDEDIRKSVRLLPSGTAFVAIEGGNHTQFGSYWDGQDASFVQPGDRPAAISADAQRRLVVQAISDLMERL